MAKFVNLTPHSINPLGMAPISASGEIARIESTLQEVAPGFYRTTLGEVVGLPEGRVGVFYIVSAMVRAAVPDRADVISPGEAVRDSAGRVIGCRGFQVNSEFNAEMLSADPDQFYA